MDQETGDDGKPDGGKIKIDKGQLQIKEDSLGIQRAVDLSSVSSAVLSFEYRRDDEFKQEFVSLDVSADGGATWTELTRFTGYDKDNNFVPINFDITTYATSSTIIRFATSSDLGGDKLFVDNLQIAFAVGEPDSTPTPIPTPEVTPTPVPTPDGAIVTLTGGVAARDEFNLHSYNNNDGMIPWADAWTEIYDDGILNSGDVGLTYLTLDDLFGSTRVLRIKEMVSEGAEWQSRHGIARSVDLSGATNAVFSFGYKRASLDVNDSLLVQASTDGGNTWSEIGRVDGGTYDSTFQYTSFNLSNHISDHTTIRFMSNFNPGDYFDIVSLDNISVQRDGVEIPGEGHPTLVDANHLHDQGLTGVGVTVAVVDSGYWPHTALNTTTDYQSGSGFSTMLFSTRSSPNGLPSARMTTGTVHMSPVLFSTKNAHLP